jgi:predicted small secreted protein
MRHFSKALVVAVCLVLSGCATNRSSGRPPARTGDALLDGQTMISAAPPRDKVLWQCRTAATAMRRGEFEEAKRLLDDALLTIGSLTADDKSAKKARGYFSEEARKTFRGEPYERVMAYFYRGILYWMDGEPDNARACFRNAQIHDADVENKQYAADYVLLDYLDGLATLKLSGDGSDAFKRAAEASKFGNPPAYDERANTLFFVELGHGPTKYATGEYKEQLRFLPGRSTAQSVVIKVDNKSIGLRPYDDLTFQATTRGGRVMDHILANQAVFKSATDMAGNVGLIGGLIVAQHRDTREIGLGLVAAGLLSKVVSAATTPAADTRAWDNLPQYLSFAAVPLPPGEHEATVEFLDVGGRPLANLTKKITINVQADKDTVVFVSDRTS